MNKLLSLPIAVIVAVLALAAASAHNAYPAPFTVTACEANAGFGTGATCALMPGSGDDNGTMIFTPGQASDVAGRFTLVFSGVFGTNEPACFFSPADGAGLYGAGRWSPGVSLVINTQSTSQVNVIWSNANLRLAGSNYNATYKINYHCDPK